MKIFKVFILSIFTCFSASTFVSAMETNNTPAFTSKESVLEALSNDIFEVYDKAIYVAERVCFQKGESDIIQERTKEVYDLSKNMPDMYALYFTNLWIYFPKTFERMLWMYELISQAMNVDASSVYSLYESMWLITQFADDLGCKQYYEKLSFEIIDQDEQKALSEIQRMIEINNKFFESLGNTLKNNASAPKPLSWELLNMEGIAKKFPIDSWNEYFEKECHSEQKLIVEGIEGEWLLRKSK